MASYDVFGNIVVWKFKRGVKLKDKKVIARDYLDTHKSVKTFLEKAEKFSGRLRTQKTKWILGEKTKEVLYKENGCVFRFNIDSCYFSPRLSSERKEVAGKVRKGENVLVMFGGVGVYGIVISKMSKARKVVSVELGRECNKYARENVKRNKLENVKVLGGEVRKVIGRMEKKEKFDRIVMARPNLKDSFLDVAFSRTKKKGVLHYYGFCLERELEGMKDLIYREAEKFKKKIKILKVKKAGEIGVRKFRYRIDVRVL